MFQMVLDGQKSIKDDIGKLDVKLSKKIDGNTERIDKLGLQLAELSDDAPTVEEHDNLTHPTGDLVCAQFLFCRGGKN